MYNMIVADDEKKLLTGLCDYYPWSDLGFRIVGRATDGQKALELIRNYLVDVVLTDISMPYLNGIQLAEIIYNEFPQIRVVLLSGYADFKYAQQALRYNVKGYLLKPVKLEELKQLFLSVKNELDEQKETFPSSIEQSEEYYEVILNRVQAYIKANLAEANLKDAAAKVKFSPSYLSVLFKSELKTTFSEFLLKTKMEAAQTFLNNPDYKIYDIAEMLGYSSPKSFSKAYRIYYGYSPRERRRNYAGTQTENET